MTLNELIKAVDTLSGDELRQLRDYVNQRQDNAQKHNSLRPGTMDVDALIHAIDQMREGLSETEIDEMIAAINAA